MVLTYVFTHIAAAMIIMINNAPAPTAIAIPKIEIGKKNKRLFKENKNVLLICFA